MPDSAAWILVVLAAVLVGAIVPVLVQLWRTLKAAEKTLETTGRRMNDALDGLTTTLTRVNQAVDGLDVGLGRISSLLESLGAIGDALARVRSSIGAVASVGSVLGGAVLAALGLGARSHRDEPVRPEPAEQEVKSL